MTDANASVARRPASASLTGLAYLAVAAAGGVAYFWDGITSLFRAWELPEYSHGPLIPLIAAFLLLREYRRAPALPPGEVNRVPGFLVILLALVVGLLGNLTQIPYFITYGLILAIGGFILLVAGSRRGLQYWPGWFYLIFMLPLPTAMYWKLSGQLQFISSKLGVELIQAVGIPVFLDGNIIDLGVYKLQVAEACSGLRYLFPLTSFSFLFAVLYRGPLWHCVLLFLSSLPITVAMNSARIGIIGILVNYFGIAQAEGFLHLFEGWIIFVACIALLYLIAWTLQWVSPKPQSLINILDIDFADAFKALRTMPVVAPAKLLAIASGLLLVSGVIWQSVPPRAPSVIERQTFTTFPLTIEGWHGTQYKLDPLTEKVLGADEYLSANYVAPDNSGQVNLFVSFYFSTTDGSGIHSPQTCIPGGGWEVSRWQQVEIKPLDGAVAPFIVNRAIIQKGLAKQVVYYWFEMRGQRYAGEYEAKFHTVWDSLTRSRADGALVRFVTPIAPGETESVADKRIMTFLSPVIAVLPTYVPK
jgi:exosortase D (VPLPA-CTERM-specific)